MSQTYEIQVALTNGGVEKIIVQARNRNNADNMARGQTGGGKVIGGRILN